MGRFSVRLYVRTYVSPLQAIQPGLRPSQLGLRPSQPGLRPSQPGLNPSQPGLRPSQLSLKPEGGTNGRTDGRTNKQKISPFYRTLSPIGAAALPPPMKTKEKVEQGKGTADHLMPLAYLFKTVHDLFRYLPSGSSWPAVPAHPRMQNNTKCIFQANI